MRRGREYVISSGSKPVEGVTAHTAVVKMGNRIAKITERDGVEKAKKAKRHEE